MKPAIATILLVLCLAAMTAVRFCGERSTASSAANRGATSSTQTSPHALTDVGTTQWHEYLGDLDKALTIGLTLRFDDYGRRASGASFDSRNLHDQRVEAEINDRAIVLRQFDSEGNATGVFRGMFPTLDPRGHFTGDLSRQVIAGTWSKPDGSGAVPFYLGLSYVAARHGSDGRYGVAGFENDATVDAFMARFRAAVLRHDTDAVAGMVHFPITVNVLGKKKTLARPTDLARNFDIIFRKEFLSRLTAAIPTHLYARSDGVMLGNGDVWVAPVPSLKAASETRPVPVVIAINN